VDPSEVVAAAPPHVGPPDAGRGYRLAGDLLAVHPADGHGTDAVVVPADAAVVSDEGAVLGPVYRRDPGPDIVVPTGRVLVRYPEGEDAGSHADELASAGYRVEQVLRYAPHAVWVRAADGGIVDSLRRLDRLERLPGVRRAEPEMLGERAWRT
jgi:hypothetical protein